MFAHTQLQSGTQTACGLRTLLLVHLKNKKNKTTKGEKIFKNLFFHSLIEKDTCSNMYYISCAKIQVFYVLFLMNMLCES